MSNSYGIPPEIEKKIRDDDKKCVYCQKEMKKFSKVGKRSDMATVEHFREKGPFYWKEGLKEEDIGICCCSCNSSRGILKLSDWFGKPYCADRAKPINENTVSKKVRYFILRTSKK